MNVNPVKHQNILDALTAFKKDMDDVEILKTTEAYGYFYATLQEIEKVIKPLLEKHSMNYYHYQDYEISLGQNSLTTVLYLTNNHDEQLRSSTLIDKEAKVGGMNRFMIEGSAVTYYRRYHITTMLGITTDEDTDAGGKRVTKKPGGKGRSIESNSTPDTGPNFVNIFKTQMEKKNKAQIEKTFELYKAQMSNDDIKQVEKLIKDKYGN